MAKKNKSKDVSNNEETLITMKQKYTKDEKALIMRFLERSEGRLAKMKHSEDSSGKQQMNIEENDPVLGAAKMMQALGTPDSQLQNYLLGQAVEVFRGCISADGYNKEKLEGFSNNSLSLLQGIAPRDEIEGMLATQMIGVHNLAMETMRRAMITGQTPIGIQDNINLAVKLLRTFTAQMEALKKYRSKGEQKVTVEHVHVNEGGQAIVGNVDTTGGRGKSEEGE